MMNINEIKEIDNEKNIEDVKKEQENNANDNIIIILNIWL